MRQVVFAIGVLLFAFSHPAEARPHHGLHKPHHASRAAHRRAHRHRAVYLPSRRNNARAARYGGRPRAWCGWWLSRHLGLNDRRLWLAREWASIGRPAHGPAPGVIAVFRHHVGLVMAVHGPGRIVLLSGNDGGAVRQRERSSRGVIAWRAF